VYRKLGHELDNWILGEFGNPTLIYEEKLKGEILIWVFFVFWAGVPRRCTEEEDHLVSICVFGELPYCDWGDLKGVRGGMFSQERTSGASCLVPGRHRGSA
jgi:hypothetical protein